MISLTFSFGRAVIAGQRSARTRVECRMNEMISLTKESSSQPAEASASAEDVNGPNKSDEKHSFSDCDYSLN